MKVAVIDVGYNSLKMVKYRVEPDGFAKSYGQFGVMAKLGENLEQTGYLGAESMDRTVDAIRLCRENASLESVRHILLVGTSPVREAANREEFLSRVHNQTGLKMRVLEGNEEALYGFLGGARAVGAKSGLFFDLGGGSLQLTYAENSKVRKIQSLPLGALRLTSEYASKDGNYSRKNRTKMAKEISGALPSRKELDLDSDALLVGTGGTIRAMARFHQNMVDYPINKIHNYTIDNESVEQMSRDFLRLGKDELGKIAAIGDGRSESVAAGAMVVRLLMKRLNFDRVVVSTHGVRDGILAEFLMRGPRSAATMASPDDVERLLAPMRFPSKSAGIAELAMCLVRNGLFNPRQEGVLLRAFQRARSQECVEVDADAVFEILMSEDHPMSHEEQLFMAISVVRSRRSKIANWLLKRYGSIMLREDNKAVRKMGACLRLMDILDRSAAQFRVSYSNGLRINVSESQGSFPLELARVAASALSASVKRPVIVTAGTKVKHVYVGPLKAGA